MRPIALIMLACFHISVREHDFTRDAPDWQIFFSNHFDVRRDRRKFLTLSLERYYFFALTQPIELLLARRNCRKRKSGFCAPIQCANYSPNATSYRVIKPKTNYHVYFRLKASNIIDRVFVQNATRFRLNTQIKMYIILDNYCTLLFYTEIHYNFL